MIDRSAVDHVLAAALSSSAAATPEFGMPLT
jgi:hypothetical protein